MKVYVVSYDLNTPGQNYDNLYKELKNSSSWWHFLDSTWLIKTTETSSQLNNRIRKNLDDNDLLMIIRVTKDYSGWLPKDAWKWMDENIKECAFTC